MAFAKRDFRAGPCGPLLCPALQAPAPGTALSPISLSTTLVSPPCWFMAFVLSDPTCECDPLVCVCLRLTDVLPASCSTRPPMLSPRGKCSCLSPSRILLGTRHTDVGHAHQRLVCVWGGCLGCVRVLAAVNTDSRTIGVLVSPSVGVSGSLTWIPTGRMSASPFPFSEARKQPRGMQTTRLIKVP